MGIIQVTTHDVIYPILIPLLSYRDWLNLRLVNKQFNKLILEYLPLNRVLYQPIRKENLFHFLTKDCRHLRVLVMSDVPWLTDNHIKQLLLRNKKLKRLELQSCLGLSQSILQVMTVQCIEIEHLLLGGCGWVMSEALEYHATHHSRLEAAKKDPNFRLDPIILLGEIGLRSKPSERKKSRYIGPENLFSRITDEKEAARIDKKYHRKKNKKYLGSLLSLDVSRSHFLDDTIFQVFFKQFNQIRYLNISNIPKLTDATLKYIAENLMKLEKLDVSENPRISDKGVYTVARYCINLSSIKIAGCIGVTLKLTKFLKKHKIRIYGESLALSNPGAGIQPAINIAGVGIQPAINIAAFQPPGHIGGVPNQILGDLYLAAPILDEAEPLNLIPPPPMPNIIPPPLVLNMSPPPPNQHVNPPPIANNEPSTSDNCPDVLQPSDKNTHSKNPPKQSKKSSSQNETNSSLPGSSKLSICEQLMRIQQIACGPKVKGLGDRSQKSYLEPGPSAKRRKLSSPEVDLPSQASVSKSYKKLCRSRSSSDMMYEATIIPSYSSVISSSSVQIDYAEALFKECQSSTDSSQIVQEGSQRSQIQPDSSVGSQMLPESSQRSQILPVTSPRPQIQPESSQLSQVHPESSQRSLIPPESSQRLQIYPEISQCLQINNDFKEVYSTDDEYAMMD